MTATYETADGNIVVAGQDFIDAYYPDAVLVQPPEPAEASQEPRLISVGAFFDRFGSLKWAILADTAPAVQAVVKDASVRKYIDLDRPDLPAGLQVLIDAGHAINADAILNTAIEPQERP